MGRLQKALDFEVGVRGEKGQPWFQPNPLKMDLECEVRFEILKRKVLVEHSKKVVGIEKGVIIMVGKGIIENNKRKTLYTTIKR